MFSKTNLFDRISLIVLRRYDFKQRYVEEERRADDLVMGNVTNIFSNK